MHHPPPPPHAELASPPVTRVRCPGGLKAMGIVTIVLAAIGIINAVIGISLMLIAEPLGLQQDPSFAVLLDNPAMFNTTVGAQVGVLIVASALILGFANLMRGKASALGFTRTCVLIAWIGQVAVVAVQSFWIVPAQLDAQTAALREMEASTGAQAPPGLYTMFEAMGDVVPIASVLIWAALVSLWGVIALKILNGERTHKYLRGEQWDPRILALEAVPKHAFPFPPGYPAANVPIAPATPRQAIPNPLAHQHGHAVAGTSDVKHTDTSDAKDEKNPTPTPSPSHDGADTSAT